MTQETASATVQSATKSGNEFSAGSSASEGSHSETIGRPTNERFYRIIADLCLRQ